MYVHARTLKIMQVTRVPARFFGCKPDFGARDVHTRVGLTQMRGRSLTSSGVQHLALHGITDIKSICPQSVVIRKARLNQPPHFWKMIAGSADVTHR